MGKQKQSITGQKSKKIQTIQPGLVENGILPVTAVGMTHYSQISTEFSNSTLSRLIERIKSL